MIGDFVEVRLVGPDDLLEQRDALFTRGARERLEGFAGGGDGLVHVRRAAQADACIGFFGGGIDDVERLRLRGGDPATVDVEFEEVLH